MKVITGNLWDIQAQVKVIPTNGNYSPMSSDPKNTLYKAVMGAGVALDAKNRYPLLPVQLGERLHKYGNRLFVFDVPQHIRTVEYLGCLTVVTCPTKDDWFHNSDENRLILSLRQLSAAQRMHDWRDVVLPELGTGKGGMQWKTVEPLMQHYLDSDVFTVVRLEK